MPSQSSSSPTSRRGGPPAACSARSARRPVKSVALLSSTSRSKPSSYGRVLLLGGDGVAGARVLGLDEDQPGLDASDVHRVDTDRVDAVATADVEETVPDGQRLIGGHPQLVALVAGVPGARHVDRRRRRSRVGRPAEVAEVGPVLAGGALQDVAAQPALQREPGGAIAHVVDLHVEPGRVQHEPPVAGVGGRDAVDSVVEARDRAVVEHLAFLVAPRASRRRDRRAAWSCRASSRGRAAAGRRHP